MADLVKAEYRFMALKPPANAPFNETSNINLPPNNAIQTYKVDSLHTETNLSLRKTFECTLYFSLY